MGVERKTVSAKLAPENSDFIADLKYKLRPYEISRSSLEAIAQPFVRRS